jgi:DNA processing protein
MSYPITSIHPQDEQYPYLLAQTHKPPNPLYYSGSLEVTAKPCISIVGSRSISAYGRQVIQLLVPALAQAGFTIISGLAYRVDAEVHESVLRYGGSCLAVQGCGLDITYPRTNNSLKERILGSGGCIVSEYTAGTPPLVHHFPERNRIVAGLSPFTLIVEAGERSGTLITARCALEEGREVGVVPADITREQSKGVHILLKQGAKAITCLEDIVSMYSLPEQLQIPLRLAPALTGSMASLYDLISQGVEITNQLVERSGLQITEVQSVLSVLESDGYIYSSGNRWQKT